MPSTRLQGVVMREREKVVDPVCGMEIDHETAIIVEHAGTSHHFCDIACAETFTDEPERWIVGPGRDPLEHTH